MGKKTQSVLGQATLMMGLMIGTFLLLFVFVIDTGMLVHAKINLQNAADVAAYAGAATQARQLTMASFLNYEMRRQWKRFLFRIYVLGNMAFDGFPRSGPASGPMTYGTVDPTTGSTASVRNFPATCILLEQNSNYCRLMIQPGISIPDPGSGAVALLDAVQQVYVQQLQSLELIRQSNCLANNQLNLMITMLWLFNADPTLQGLLSSSDATVSGPVNLLQAFSQGLGIVPTEILLQFRMQTMQDILNTASQTAVDITQVANLSAQLNPYSAERTVQAFYSAYYSIGPDIFDASTLQLTELMPGSSQAALVKFSPITIGFDACYVAFGVAGGAPSSNSQNCTATLSTVSVGDSSGSNSYGLTVGYSKDPNVPTYYAVSLQASARLLFWPFGDAPILKAYALARPFGSRIGPLNQNVRFVSSMEVGTAFGGTLLIPNLQVGANDTAVDTYAGWNTMDMLSRLYTVYSSTGNSGYSSASIGDIAAGSYLAGAANPWEIGQYNMPDSDDFLNLTATPAAFNQEGYMALIPAPLSVTPQVNTDNITNAFNNIFTNKNIVDTANTTAPSSLNQILVPLLKTYLEGLISAPSVTGETWQNAVIGLPLPVPLAAGGAASSSTAHAKAWLSQSSDLLFVRSHTALRTSWNHPYYLNQQQQGRIGYSVKFVPFSSLSDAFAQTTDEVLKGDLQKIQH